MGETAVQTTPLDEESSKVINWRLQWLTHAGYSKRNAELIATSRIDLWFACDALTHALTHGYDEDYVMRLLL